MTDQSDTDDSGNDDGVSRRSVIGALGGIAGLSTTGAAALSGQSDGDPSIQAGGLARNLTQQYQRGQYVTAPATAFDPSQLDPGQLFWLQDGEIGIKDENGGTVHPPIGSPDQPVSAVHTDSLNNGGPISDGDGTERQIWIIANGASDPAGADPEDIIFEEES